MILRAALLVAVVSIPSCPIGGSGDAPDGSAQPATDAATAATAETGLPPECETFLAQYTCFLQKNGKPLSGAEPMRTSYTQMGSSPATRGSVIAQCKSQ